MLHLIEVSNFEDRIPFLKKAHQDGTYMVSDIKSKFQFQKFLLEKNSFVQESSVTRASDFYCELIKENFPQYQFISIPELQFLFKDFIQKTEKVPYANPSLYNNILIVLQSFLPFLSHPSGSETFEQWIKASQQKRWSSSYSLAKPFWNYLNEKKLIEESLSKYILIDQKLKKLSYPLYIDLGFSIDAAEVELLSSLGKHEEVYILCPPPLDPKIYPQSHQMYELLKEKPHQFQSTTPKEKTADSVFQFSSMLEEVRFITQQLRKDLTTCSPADLVVIAPDMDSYWPTLKGYLEKEGVPVSKGTEHPLLSFPQIQQWLSLIHFYSGDISYNNIEYFAQIHQSPKSFSKIQSQYYYADRIKDRPSTDDKSKERDSSELIEVDQFLKWIFNLWSSISKNSPNEKLDQKLQSLGQQLKNVSQEKILVSDALELLEHLLISKNLHVSNPVHGVQFINVNAITSIRAKKVYIMGLDHQSCLMPSLSLFTEKEAQNILNDLGFYCHYLNPNQKEYEIINFIRSFEGSILLSYSETHLSGAPQHPSKTWLLASQNKKISSANKVKTVWDSIQKNQSSKIFEASLKQNFKWPKGDRVSLEKLSASRIKQYSDCPFIYLSKNIFHLEDEPLRDHSLSPMHLGSLLHELFASIKNGDIKTPEEVIPWLQKIQSNYPVLEESVWNVYKDQLTKLAARFIKKEEDFKKTLPHLKTLGTEIEFEGYWNLKDQKLSSDGDIFISGRIDRVDMNQDEYVVLDYKSSIKKTPTIRSWIEKVDVQMPLYIQAIESNLLKEKKISNADVSTACYVDSKSFEWKGFVSKFSEVKNIFKKRSHSIVENQMKQDAVSEINNKIGEYILKIQENEFQPQPLDQDTCDECSWRKLCRAPHLNL